jgi:hypothetical protein
MKTALKKDFKAIYGDNKRLLAVQLNGFSHAVIYDNGRASSTIIIERYSPHLSSFERTGAYTKQAEKLLNQFSTYQYKHNPKEIIYTMPNDR